MNVAQKILYSAAWQAPSNIALIKYWGKYGAQLPMNPSLSLTLANSVSRCRLLLFERATPNGPLSLSLMFGEEEVAPESQFYQKIWNYLEVLRPRMEFLSCYHLHMHSSNSFPHSAGIASSASSFAALACALADLHAQVMGQTLHDLYSMNDLSSMARLGSGSAARSLNGPLMLWGHDPTYATSSNEHAIDLLGSLDRGQVGALEELKTVHDAILMVSSEKKAVSSTAGHALMNQHPYRQARIDSARANFKSLIQAGQAGQWRDFFHVVEQEAYELHGLLMTSHDHPILMRPETLTVIARLRFWRQSHNIDCGFTLDAGPNVHLLYFRKDRQAILSFIESIRPLLEGGQWIDDYVGTGAMTLT